MILVGAGCFLFKLFGLLVFYQELLHRSDFFPGLGWMLTREFWLEIRDQWPQSFWDDWLRKKEIRKDRACIRPEISRTGMSNNGKVGVSK